MPWDEAGGMGEGMLATLGVAVVGSNVVGETVGAVGWVGVDNGGADGGGGFLPPFL